MSAAYRRAADTVARPPQPLREVFAVAGTTGLDALPGVGPRIAAAMAELPATGRWPQLERLRSSANEQVLFRTVPGVGPDLCRRLHETLGVDTLEALESAVPGGRLEATLGIGPLRPAAIGAA